MARINRKIGKIWAHVPKEKNKTGWNATFWFLEQYFLRVRVSFTSIEYTLRNLSEQIQHFWICCKQLKFRIYSKGQSSSPGSKSLKYIKQKVPTSSQKSGKVIVNRQSIFSYIEKKSMVSKSVDTLKAQISFCVFLCKRTKYKKIKIILSLKSFLKIFKNS